MQVTAWIQMGTERRETTFEVDDAWLGPDGQVPEWVHEAVLEWMGCRVGYGWRCGDSEMDLSAMEGADDTANLCVVREVLGPGTVSVPARPVSVHACRRDPRLGPTG